MNDCSNEYTYVDIKRDSNIFGVGVKRWRFEAVKMFYVDIRGNSRVHSFGVCVIDRGQQLM